MEVFLLPSNTSLVCLEIYPKFFHTPQALYMGTLHIA